MPRVFVNATQAYSAVPGITAGLPHLWIKKSDGGLGASPPAGVKVAAPRRMSSFLN